MSKSADAFRTISEVADWLGIPAHVLRFWESKFTQVKPVKRAGGRRYYRPADMQLLGGIRKLLHDEGMTIKGVQKIMREQGVKHVMALSPQMDAQENSAMDEVTLEVAPQVEEERGQVLSFGRSGAENAEADNAARPQEPPDQTPEDATPAEGKPATKPDPKPVVAKAEESPASNSVTVQDTPAPKMAEPKTPESDTTELDTPELETPEEPAKPRARAITTPDDSPDTVAAPAGPLTTLADLPRPLSSSNASALTAIAKRLRDLRNGGSTGAAP